MGGPYPPAQKREPHNPAMNMTGKHKIGSPFCIFGKIVRIVGVWKSVRIAGKETKEIKGAFLFPYTLLCTSEINTNLHSFCSFGSIISSSTTANRFPSISPIVRKNTKTSISINTLDQKEIGSVAIIAAETVEKAYFIDYLKRIFLNAPCLSKSDFKVRRPHHHRNQVYSLFARRRTKTM